jgi:SNF family Na+-dependent transporter
LKAERWSSRAGFIFAVMGSAIGSWVAPLLPILLSAA